MLRISSQVHSTITPATLVITANPASRVYGAADPTFTDTISGFIEGQTLATSGVTGAPSFTTTASSTSHVGNNYEIVPGTGSLQSADYLFSFVPDTLTITPAPLTIKANNTSQPFGTTPSLSASYIGLVNGDTAASLAAPRSCPPRQRRPACPGTYPITVSGASSAELLHHVRERHVHGPASVNFLIVGGADPQVFGDVACDFHRGCESSSWARSH